MGKVNRMKVHLVIQSSSTVNPQRLCQYTRKKINCYKQKVTKTIYRTNIFRLIRSKQNLNCKPHIVSDICAKV